MTVTRLRRPAAASPSVPSLRASGQNSTKGGEPRKNRCGKNILTGVEESLLFMCGIQLIWAPVRASPPTTCNRSVLTAQQWRQSKHGALQNCAHRLDPQGEMSTDARTSVCPHICLPAHLFACTFVCPHICLPAHFVCPHICLPAHLFARALVCPHIGLHLFARTFVCPDICLPAHLFARTFVFQSTSSPKSNASYPFLSVRETASLLRHWYMTPLAEITRIQDHTRCACNSPVPSLPSPLGRWAAT
jgi:hypothetical protein